MAGSGSQAYLRRRGRDDAAEHGPQRRLERRAQEAPAHEVRVRRQHGRQRRRLAEQAGRHRGASHLGLHDAHQEPQVAGALLARSRLGVLLLLLLGRERRECQQVHDAVHGLGHVVAMQQRRQRTQYGDTLILAHKLQQRRVMERSVRWCCCWCLCLRLGLRLRVGSYVAHESQQPLIVRAVDRRHPQRTSP